MIRVERPSRAPTAISGRAATAARKQAGAFFRSDMRKRAQQSYQFEASIFDNPALREALSDLFHAKCAYCETRFGYDDWGIDHFRPMANALAIDGAVASDHYWWLAYEWKNLFPACVDCMRAKGSRFPVRGERASPGGPQRSLGREEALLVDPTVDKPAEHFEFREDGEVVPLSERGQVSIDVLALNRGLLVRSRRTTYALLLTERRKVVKFPNLARDVASAAQEHAALRRQVVDRWLGRGEDPGQRAAAPTKGLGKFSAGAAIAAVDSEAAAGEMALKSRLIERINLRNIRVFRELNLTITSAAQGRAPWTMLLGENGTGKSTLLEAVALTLAGSERAASLDTNAAEYVRRRAKGAAVEVRFSGYGTPIRLELSQQGISQATPAPASLLLAYGPTRLLPMGGHEPDPAPFARIRNLFDPFTPLADANAWLLTLERARFDRVARAMRGVLALRGDAEVDRDERRGEVRIGVGKSTAPLHQLSAGYQSAVALVCDIASVVLNRWESTEVAEGIVLIDEIDAHLHPSWRMRIVSGLRAAFPRVQVIATTHDPLCLRGLEDGEAVVLRQALDGSVFVVSDLPSVAGMRVDQLLMSEHFGLDSTLDPELDAAFSEYYLLRAKHRPTTGERRRLVALAPIIQHSRILGDNQRDRLILEAADEFLADERIEPDGSRRDELRADAKKHIKALWGDLAQ